MGRAIWLVVRWIVRRHRLASVLLAVVVAFAATCVAVPLQAARRSETSLDRHLANARLYDRFVLGCPPGVDVGQIEGQADLITKCANPAQMARLAKVVRRLPGVELADPASTIVVAILDGHEANGWGRLILGTAGGGYRPFAMDRMLLVSGRLPRATAADEIVIGEAAARRAGIRAGDEVHLAGWSQAQLDSAIDGKVRPSTKPFRTTVAGIVRSLDDVQLSGEGNLSGSTLPSQIYAGPAWYRAHASDFSGYGTGLLVRLRDGEAGVAAFQRALEARPGGWFIPGADSIVSGDLGSLRRVLSLERQSVLMVALIASLAALVFVGLTMGRQVRRELADASTLSALGFSRRDLAAIGLVRAGTVMVPAIVLAVAATVVASRFGPVGLAGRLEYTHPMRFDVPVLLAMATAIASLLAGAAAAAALGSQRRARVPVLRGIRFDRLHLLPAPGWVGASFARGGAARAAMAGGAIATAALVVAGGLTGSFDHMVAAPERYGATWDLVVGQYSEPDALRVGVAALRANPNVSAAAGYDEITSGVKVDGRAESVLAFTPYVGRIEPVMAEGRAPGADDEAALGRETAHRLHRRIGDTIRVSGGKVDRRLRVVGIVVVNDPVSSNQPAGAGVFVLPSIAGPLSQSVPQSVVVRLDPRRDRARAVQSVVQDFSGSVREALPPADVRNVGRIRSVPWLLAALIGALAGATVLNAIVNLLARRRTDLAVLGALGFTGSQRRRVGSVASAVALGLGGAVGVPVGLVISRVIWRAIASGLSIPAPPRTPWAVMVLAPTALVALGVVLAHAIAWRPTRVAVAEALRVE